LTITDKKEIGNQGEALALQYLEKLDYQILGTNVQCGRSEIDIIATIHDTLVFVEVKTRKTAYFGYPESFVTEQKQKVLARGAQWYIEKNNYNGEIRFDIIAVIISPAKSEIEHFEDAFWLRG
jgi:putative endonuclease